MRIDLIIDQARIWTGDPNRPRATKIGVLGGRVVGLDEQLDGVSAEVVLNAEGAFLAPGFNDVHSHSVWFGQTLLELDLTGTESAEELLKRVSEHAETLPESSWVIASNFNPLGIRGEMAPRDALDEASGGRPLWLKHSSGHDSIEGGQIVTDAAGRATGLIEENAMLIVQGYHLPDSRADIAKALEVATAQYLREGLTSVTDAGIAGGWIGHSPQEFGAYQFAQDQGVLGTRMQPMITLDALHDLPGHENDPAAIGLTGGLRTGLGDEWLQVGPVKVFTDGSLLGSTAAMTEDYEQCPGNHG